MESSKKRGTDPSSRDLIYVEAPNGGLVFTESARGFGEYSVSHGRNMGEAPPVCTMPPQTLHVVQTFEVQDGGIASGAEGVPICSFCPRVAVHWSILWTIKPRSRRAH